MFFWFFLSDYWTFPFFFRFGFLWIWIWSFSLDLDLVFLLLDTGFVNPFVLRQRWSVMRAKGNLFDKGKGASDEGRRDSVKELDIRN